MVADVSDRLTRRRASAAADRGTHHRGRCHAALDRADWLQTSDLPSRQRRRDQLGRERAACRSTEMSCGSTWMTSWSSATCTGTERWTRFRHSLLNTSKASRSWAGSGCERDGHPAARVDRHTVCAARSAGSDLALNCFQNLVTRRRQRRCTVSAGTLGRTRPTRPSRDKVRLLSQRRTV